MFSWNDDKVRWFFDAENYTNFFKKLQDNIKEYIGKEETLLDVGCGLGILSGYMAKFCKKVTAIDIDKTVIDFAKKSHDIQNIDFLNISLDEFAKKEIKFDVVTACQFGSGDENYKKILNMAEKKAIFIKNVNRSKTKVGRHRSTVSDLEKFLEKENYKFKTFNYRYNFDQVLKNLDDAQNFIDSYGIEDVDIEKIEDEKFNYIIRKPKNIAIVVVDK